MSDTKFTLRQRKYPWADGYTIDELLALIKNHRHALQPGQIGEAVDKISDRLNDPLIAAAPDMYEALKAMRFAYMNKDGEYPHDFEIEAIDMYEYAMKKAEGKV